MTDTPQTGDSAAAIARLIHVSSESLGRHCEERSDEAIHPVILVGGWIAASAFGLLAMTATALVR